MYRRQGISLSYSNDLADYFKLPGLAREKIFKPLDLVDLTVLTQEALLQNATAGFVNTLFWIGLSAIRRLWLSC
jgi:hypothetical protein